MKKIALLTAALAVCASTAFAVGVDLNWNACPGGLGASQAAVLDCAGGGGMLGCLTFAPAENIPDLVAVDCLIDIQISGGDINSSANFWDFSNVNNAALGINHLRPANCTAYANTWNKTGAGVSLATLVRSPTQIRVSCGAYRPDIFDAAGVPAPVGAAANEKLFGLQMTIDGSTAAEAGGAATGCTLPAAVVVQQATPQSQTGLPTTILMGPNVNADPVAHLNGDNTPASAVPTARHTWSQLKSLYR